MGINLTPYALLFTVAAVGISEASYLIRKRIAAERPICPIGKGCEIVLNSRYNRLFGIHNDILGIVFYILMSGFAAFLVIGFGPADLWLKITWLLLAGGTLMSAVLIYLQWKVIKAWCFWCLMSAATVVIMDIIVLTGKLSG